VTGSLAGVSDDPGQGANDDELVGTSGNNTLDGGTGADVMAGLAGDDTYHVDNFDDWVIEAAGQGTDTIVSTVSILMPANVENLVLRAISAEGNDLNNVIVASNGNNYIDGKGGIDTISYADAPGPVKASVSLASIQSTISSGKDMLLNFENLTGSAFDDTLGGSAGANVIDGGAGADVMSGAAGDDTYIVDNVGDVTTGEAGGVDTVKASVSWTLASGFENLVLTGAAVGGTGNSVANKLTGNASNNVLSGLAGNDLLDGGAGDDQMIGGVGNDSYVVDSAGDIVTENSGEGTDTVEAASNYTLGANLERLLLTGSATSSGTGNTLSNTLTGNSAANSLYGLSGNDTLDGAGGADQMFGSTGNDTYVVDNLGDAVTENGSEGTDVVKSSINYTLGVNVENLTLTGSSALQGTGNTAANVLTGNSGANTLYGLGGNDTLDGSSGADNLFGGTGNDIYVVDNAGDNVTEVSGEGTDTVKSSISYTLGAEVEKLTLTGTAGIAGKGNELANTLTGNTGNNQLDGGAGIDILAGGKGLDTLIGGLGADKFDFNALTDSVVGAGRDLVLDFSRSQGDKIDLLTIDANTLIAGNQVFAFFGDSAFSGIAGQVRAVVDGISGGTLVQGDVNGDGVADFEVGLVGLNTAMVASDFVL
jgi:Ca2+-binding RTX toxin-like protein